MNRATLKTRAFTTVLHPNGTCSPVFEAWLVPHRTTKFILVKGLITRLTDMDAEEPIFMEGIKAQATPALAGYFSLALSWEVRTVHGLDTAAQPGPLALELFQPTRRFVAHILVFSIEDCDEGVFLWPLPCNPTQAMRDVIMSQRWTDTVLLALSPWADAAAPTWSTFGAAVEAIRGPPARQTAALPSRLWTPPTMTPTPPPSVTSPQVVYTAASLPLPPPLPAVDAIPAGPPRKAPPSTPPMKEPPFRAVPPMKEPPFRAVKALPTGVAKAMLMAQREAVQETRSAAAQADIDAAAIRTLPHPSTGPASSTAPPPTTTTAMTRPPSTDEPEPEAS